MMQGSGFFRGTSVGQDGRFSNKEEATLKMMAYPAEYSQKVRMEKVNVAKIGEWMQKRLTELLGLEDDVTSGMFLEYLESGAKEGKLDPRRLQYMAVPFLNADAMPFVRELWLLLLDAQTQPDGIPATLKAPREPARAIVHRERSRSVSQSRSRS